jgi:hypothetical protein
MIEPDPIPQLPSAETCSRNSIDFHIVDTDAVPGDLTPTPEGVLRMMRNRLKVLGKPLPDGYVAPAGIDLDALLKLVPWPPAA